MFDSFNLRNTTDILEPLRTPKNPTEKWSTYFLLVQHQTALKFNVHFRQRKIPGDNSWQLPRFSQPSDLMGFTIENVYEIENNIIMLVG